MDNVIVVTLTVTGLVGSIFGVVELWTDNLHSGWRHFGFGAALFVLAHGSAAVAGVWILYDLNENLVSKRPFIFAVFGGGAGLTVLRSASLRVPGVGLLAVAPLFERVIANSRAVVRQNRRKQALRLFKAGFRDVDFAKASRFLIEYCIPAERRKEKAVRIVFERLAEIEKMRAGDLQKCILLAIELTEFAPDALIIEAANADILKRTVDTKSGARTLSIDALLSYFSREN